MEKIPNTGDKMAGTEEIQNWKIDGWGLVRGLAMLSSTLVAITVLHYLVLAVVRG